MRLGYGLIVGVLAAQGAIAGPWLRDAGKGFFSASSKIDQTLQTETALYLEYGLRPKLTLGAKVDMAMTPQGSNDISFLAFMRRPIGPRDRKMLYAYDLGLGYRDQAPSARLGLTLGRGIKLGKRYGWAVLDTSIDLGQEPLFKADATVGLTLNDRWKTMAQIFVSHEANITEVTFAPSVIWSPKTGKPSYQAGLESKEGELGLRLSLWRDF